MLHSHHHHLLFSVPLPLTHHQPSPSLPLVHFLPRQTATTKIHTVSAFPSTWLTQFTTQELGPIELPFSATDDPSTIQLLSSVLLSGTITLFFFRSIQRRAKRARELKFRSSGVKKSLDNLKAMRSSGVKAKNPPSPDQALLGAIIAGVIAVILYKFTTTIEATLGRQTLSDNFSVRQITITIRTIINGLCYLATFVYGFNSVGLFLYSGQLVMDTFGGGSTTRKESQSKILDQTSVENLTNNKLSSTKEDQNSNS